jgi:hypothetical protein
VTCASCWDSHTRIFRSLFKCLAWFLLLFWCVVFYYIIYFIVMYYEAFCLYIASSFFCKPVFCPLLGLYSVPLKSLYSFYNLFKCYLDVCLTYFISAADITIILASLVTMILFPLPYNKFYSASLLSSFLNTVIKTAFFHSSRIQILFIYYLNL